MIKTKIIVVKSLELSPRRILRKKDQATLLAKMRRLLKNELRVVEVAMPKKEEMPEVYETGRIIAEDFGIHSWEENELNLEFPENERMCLNAQGDCKLLAYALENFSESLHKNVIRFARLFKRLSYTDKTFILISEKPELSALIYYILLSEWYTKEAEKLLEEDAFAPMEHFTIEIEDKSVFLPERYPDYHMPFHDQTLEEKFEMVKEEFIEKT